jgi:hypothetical protein
MKKVLVIVSALILTAACAAPSNNREAPTANTNSAATPVAAMLSEADAIAKEKASWAAIQKKDYVGFGDMLATDYIEVGDAGTWDKPGILEHLKDLEISDVTFSDWKMIPVDNNAVLLTYSVNVKASFKGKEVPPGPYRASAAWVNRAGKWVAAYYQETLAKPSMPPPPAAKTSTTSSASPAARPAETTIATDPVSSEKMAWDALKRKDYDTFASFLDAGQIEVEADGVYDKAGTLKGVRMFDASKYELSDFKTANLDSDAALVTYVSKSSDPKAPQERHTTIWVKRDGKWRALFHHGTPAASPSATAAASPSPKASPTAKASPSPRMAASPKM